MPVDLNAATAFMATHARVLDRRRFDALLGDDDPAGILDAVEAYAQPRRRVRVGPRARPALARESARRRAARPRGVRRRRAPALAPQPGAVRLAARGHPPRRRPPVRTAGARARGHRTVLGLGRSTTSSLQITAIVAATAHRVAAHDPDVAGHPWLGRRRATASTRSRRWRSRRSRWRWRSRRSCSTPRRTRARRSSELHELRPARREAARPRWVRGRVHAAARLRAVPGRPARELLDETRSPPTSSGSHRASRRTAAGPSTSRATPGRRAWSGAAMRRWARSCSSARTASCERPRSAAAGRLQPVLDHRETAARPVVRGDERGVPGVLLLDEFQWYR